MNTIELKPQENGTFSPDKTREEVLLFLGISRPTLTRYLRLLRKFEIPYSFARFYPRQGRFTQGQIQYLRGVLILKQQGYSNRDVECWIKQHGFNSLSSLSEENSHA